MPLYGVTTKAMERSMVGISLRNKIRNEQIKKRIGVKDIIDSIAQLKWQSARHMARQQDRQWIFGIK